MPLTITPATPSPSEEPARGQLRALLTRYDPRHGLSDYAAAGSSS